MSILSFLPEYRGVVWAGGQAGKCPGSGNQVNNRWIVGTDPGMWITGDWRKPSVILRWRVEVWASPMYWLAIAADARQKRETWNSLSPRKELGLRDWEIDHKTITTMMSAIWDLCPGECNPSYTCMYLYRFMYKTLVFLVTSYFRYLNTPQVELCYIITENYCGVLKSLLSFQKHFESDQGRKWG